MFFVIAKIIQLNAHFFKKITGNNIKLRIVNAEKEKKPCTKCCTLRVLTAPANECLMLGFHEIFAIWRFGGAVTFLGL